MKNTYLSSFGPFFIFVGLRWPSLVAVGLPGLRSNKKIIYGMTTGCKNKMIVQKKHIAIVVWALFRLCGPALAVVGCCGPSWACVGLRWLSLAAVGLPGL